MVYPIGKLLRPIFTFPVKEVKGLENLPKDTPFVITSNHNSFIDPNMLAYEITKHLKNKKIYFVSHSNLFSKFLAYLFFSEIGGIILLKKEDYTSFVKSAHRHLRKGHIIGIFPEGAHNKKPNLRRGKTGIARFVLEEKVPVIPIGIKGSLYVWSYLKKIPRPKKRVIIKIGKPLYFDKYYGKNNDYSILREITTTIMKEIALLTDQKYNF